MYVCPRCKGPLVEYSCSVCRSTFTVVEGIPDFLSATTGSDTHRLGEIYDDIYSRHVNAWVDQGRSEAFLRYFCQLTASSPSDQLLEIGCGEGMLLEALQGSTKFGIDPSVQALLRAKRRSRAECAVAQAEALPFPSECFDVVVAVGVMEHFEDADAATAEIRRVLKPSGRYVTLIQTDMSRFQRLAVKVREYLFPRFHPIALLKWVDKKLRHRIVQPYRRSYTADAARQCLERNGLQVTQIVTRKSEPRAPLAGDHVVVLLSRNGRGS